MDNLELLHCQSVEVTEKISGNQRAYCYAEGSSHVVCGKTLYIYDDKKGNYSNHHIDKITGDLKYVRYISLNDIVFLATEKELLIFDHKRETSHIGHMMKKSLVEISWNPTDTLLVAIESDYNISTFTFSKISHSFDIKHTVSLDAAVPIPVLIGWGSQNTQFKGPKQRQAADTTKNAEVQKIVSHGPPRISWRGNSELFVVNYFKQEGRFLKVFDCDLNPLNQSEDYPNLLEPVAFMGQGQCIACCASKSNINELIIFEKNCKVKAVFELSDIKGSIQKLQYHSLMNLLAIQSFYEDQCYISIYLYSNARWFLKQQLVYPSNCKVFGFEWVDLQEHLFTTCKIVVFTSENIEHHIFRFVINRSPLSATVAVVNGRTIEFSMFDKKVIPPPMSFDYIQHVRPINRILFHPTKPLCVIIDSAFQVGLLEFDEHKKVALTMIQEQNFNMFTNSYSIVWAERDIIDVNISGDIEKEICASKIVGDIALRLKTVKKVPEKLILQYNDTNTLESHKFLEDETTLIYLTKRIFYFNDSEVHFECALSKNREFFLNDDLVCTGVTSFFIFKDYLMFTHVNCKLYCMRLKDSHGFCSNMDLSKIFSREIETGGRIVTCNNTLPPQIILQLPRGNLESIGCKLMTIDVVEGMLQQNNWKAALNILRTEKVNWNVLIDLNPTRFCEHIGDFVEAARNSAVLSSIVTDFNLTENCFQTFYKNYLTKALPAPKYNKRKIVENILEYLVSTDCLNNLACIIAIQLKHISLKSALKSIKDIFEADPEKYESVCSKAINQLLIQEHFKDVLNATFCFFNLEFLSLVYHNSTEDPKVYEPELANLRKMLPVEQRFHMCLKGNDLKKSVKYVLRCPAFSEKYISDFILNNKLEEEAYFSVKPFHEHCKLVTRLFAKRLSLQQKYIEAGLILKRSELLEEALIQYTNALEWREVLGLMTLLKFNEERKNLTLYDLSQRLLRANRVDDAVIVIEHYLKDYEKAILTLVEYKSFRKAVCVAHSYGAIEITNDTVIPQLENYVSDLIEKISGFNQTFSSYASRLETVRQEKKIKLENASLGIYEGDDDLYSESGSTISSLGSSRATSRSRGSTASSKNRRKEERKKIDLREGGYYEDIALIRALHILYTETFKFGQEVREICLITEYTNLEMFRRLHDDLKHLQKDMIKRIPDIWSEVFIRDTDSSDFATLAVIQNKQDLDPKYCTPPPEDVANLSWTLDIYA
ncbi:unnamed protein product [Phaedon cochleariae]|uniref:Elongator complex protein 1 n=1 Tax=Phaedon cochleariae TaxID=80249 RepID=A0A9N9SEQ0_PHACE|nr:unnamed protein product [Phaedon cochleariae]